MNRAHFLSPHLCLCRRFYKIIVFNLKTSDIQLLLIYFSGIASSVLMNHNHGSFFWLLCFPWVGESYPLQVWAIFRSCPGSGQDLWQKQGKGSTTKRDPGKFLPWHVQDQPWNQHRSSLWSWFQEVLHFAGQVAFIYRRQSNSLWNFSSLFQCLIYGFLVSNIYKSSLVAHLTRPSYSKTVVLNTHFLTSPSSLKQLVLNTNLHILIRNTRLTL